MPRCMVSASPDSFNFGVLRHRLGRIELAAWRQVSGVSMDHSRCVVQIRENRFFTSVSAIAA